MARHPRRPGPRPESRRRFTSNAYDLVIEGECGWRKETAVGENAHSIKKQARIAGLLYPSVALTAPFSLIYVPQALIVRGDASATAARIQAPEMPFRFNIAGKVVISIT